MKLLHIDTSILGDNSVTRELSALIVQRLTAGTPGATVTHRDLAADSLPHLTMANLPGAHPKAPASGINQAERAVSDQVLREFLDADTVVIGAPMYNFTIPSQLKAWVDRILVPGTTFRYGPNGPEGAAGGKRVVVAIARGGFYGPDTAQVSAEHAESYMRQVFGFIGVTDLRFVLAEGLATGEHSKVVGSAREAVGQLAA